MPSTGGNLGSVSRWCSSTKSDLYTINMICNSKSCFSVGKVNKIGLTFVSTEQHSENMAIQRLSKLLLRQLYLCSSVSVVMEVLLFASQGKNEYRKVSEEELILQARNKFWCLGFIQTLKSDIPCSLTWARNHRADETSYLCFPCLLLKREVLFFEGGSTVWCFIETPEISPCLPVTTHQVWTRELQVNLNSLFIRMWTSNKFKNDLRNLIIQWTLSCACSSGL